MVFFLLRSFAKSLTLKCSAKVLQPEVSGIKLWHSWPFESSVLESLCQRVLHPEFMGAVSVHF